MREHPSLAKKKLISLLNVIDVEDEEEKVGGRSRKRIRTTKKDVSSPKQKARFPGESFSSTYLDSKFLDALGALDRDSSKNYENQEVKLDPLVAITARFPPPPNSVIHFLEQKFPQLKEDRPDEEYLKSAIVEALRICNGVATNASEVVEAVTVFEPVIVLLQRLSDVQDFTTSTSEERSKREHICSIAESLASKLLQCIHVLTLECQMISQSTEEGYSEHKETQWLLQWDKRTYSLLPELKRCRSTDFACSLANKVISLKNWFTLSRNVFEHGSLPVMETLSPLVACDMNLLNPYAPMGHLKCIEKLVFEEMSNGELDSVTSFLRVYNSLVLYSAASEVIKATTSMAVYFTFLSASRAAAVLAGKAAQINTSLKSSRIDRSLEKVILEKAAGFHPPLNVFQWLEEQPPSVAIDSCMKAYAKGPIGLSNHLIYEAPLTSVRALAAAARLGGVVHELQHTKSKDMKDSRFSNDEGADDGRDIDTDEGFNLTDELLFFESTEGDAKSMFGQDWHLDTEDEDDEASDREQDQSSAEDRTVGVDLEALATEYALDESEENGDSD